MSNLTANQVQMPQMAVQRRIDTIWSVLFEIIDDTSVVIIGLTDKCKQAYDFEGSYSAYDFVESDGLTVTSLKVKDSKGGDIREYVVLNPQYILSYMTDFSNLIASHEDPTKLQWKSDFSTEIDIYGTSSKMDPMERHFISSLNRGYDVHINGMRITSLDVQDSIIELYVADRLLIITRDHLQWCQEFTNGYFRNVECPTLDARVHIKMNFTEY